LNRTVAPRQINSEPKAAARRSISFLLQPNEYATQPLINRAPIPKPNLRFSFLATLSSRSPMASSGPGSGSGAGAGSVGGAPGGAPAGAAKKFVLKPWKATQALDQRQALDLWLKLRAAIERIHNREVSQLLFEELYRCVGERSRVGDHMVAR